MSSSTNSKPTTVTEEDWNPADDSINHQEVADDKSEDDLCEPSDYILQISQKRTSIEKAQLTTVTSLPPNHPFFLHHEFYWGVCDEKLKRKIISYDSNIWDDLLSNKDIAFGNFATDDFPVEKQNDYVREMVNESIFFLLSKDKMNIYGPQDPLNLALVGGKNGLDKKRWKLLASISSKLIH